METDVHFARLLADLPEALVCDEAFLGELAKNAKLISVKKGDYLLPVSYTHLTLPTNSLV